ALADPLAGVEAGQLCAVEPATSTIVDVLDHRAALLGLTELPQPSHAAVFPVGHLAFEQQRDALLEGELLGGGIGHLLAQGERHAVELQAVQCIESGLDEHGSSSPSVVDGVAVWVVVARKYSAPRRLAC